MMNRRFALALGLLLLAAGMSAPALIGPLLGPTVGGLIVHWTSWRAIFFINVPFGLIAMYLVWRHMPDYHGDERRPRSRERRGFHRRGSHCSGRRSSRANRFADAGRTILLAPVIKCGVGDPEGARHFVDLGAVTPHGVGAPQMGLDLALRITSHRHGCTRFRDTI